jgi:hypothetical protein
MEWGGMCRGRVKGITETPGLHSGVVPGRAARSQFLASSCCPHPGLVEQKPGTDNTHTQGCTSRALARHGMPSLPEPQAGTSPLSPLGSQKLWVVQASVSLAVR